MANSTVKANSPHTENYIDQPYELDNQVADFAALVTFYFNSFFIIHFNLKNITHLGDIGKYNYLASITDKRILVESELREMMDSEIIAKQRHPNFIRNPPF